MERRKLSITDFFTDEQLEKLAKAFIASRKVGEEFHESEVGKVWEWATKVMFEKSMLDLVLEGTLTVRIGEDGEAVFQKIAEKEGDEKGED